MSILRSVLLRRAPKGSIVKSQSRTGKGRNTDMFSVKSALKFTCLADGEKKKRALSHQDLSFKALALILNLPRDISGISEHMGSVASDSTPVANADLWSESR